VQRNKTIVKTDAEKAKQGLQKVKQLKL
jgi:hypothetical protein